MTKLKIILKISGQALSSYSNIDMMGKFTLGDILQLFPAGLNNSIELNAAGINKISTRKYNLLIP